MARQRTHRTDPQQPQHAHRSDASSPVPSDAACRICLDPLSDGEKVTSSTATDRNCMQWHAEMAQGWAKQ